MKPSLITNPLNSIFEKLAKETKLIFASGSDFHSVNLLGKIKVERATSGKEDFIEFQACGCHIHVDWAKITKVDLKSFYGEGLLEFYHESELLFKIYRPEGEFDFSEGDLKVS